jgi:hypothetical protein
VQSNISITSEERDNDRDFVIGLGQTMTQAVNVKLHTLKMSKKNNTVIETVVAAVEQKAQAIALSIGKQWTMQGNNCGTFSASLYVCKRLSVDMIDDSLALAFSAGDGCTFDKSGAIVTVGRKGCAAMAGQWDSERNVRFSDGAFLALGKAHVADSDAQFHLLDDAAIVAMIQRGSLGDCKVASGHFAWTDRDGDRGGFDAIVIALGDLGYVGMITMGADGKAHIGKGERFSHECNRDKGVRLATLGDAKTDIASAIIGALGGKVGKGKGKGKGKAKS